ncbi:YceI family protein [Alkalicaulis satelles]|uniref:YceI family protein n=1 Tax=Alkalicaulis satelles TaxID=2609175 RepID=A0A5M6ZA68_9PROT|nr:YceI family protein [Alkalicaulis satelles]KAA5801599.1 YceI family protein [Alkalicaulis satelles]
MRLTAASLAVMIAAASSASAQDWVLDHDASAVSFEIAIFGAPAEARFDDFDAQITLDPEDLASARIEAVVRTASGAMDISDYQQALLSGDGLAPRAHPEARFSSEDVRATDEGYEAHGVLTVRGSDSPAVLSFTLEIDGGRAVARGGFDLSRTDFGISAASWGANNVGEAVRVRVHIEADAG